MNRNELEQKLTLGSVSVDSWGKGSAKTFSHLEKELNDGESKLMLSKEGLLRIEEGVWIDVFYRDEAKIYRLAETKQIFRDGRIRIRNNENSIGEKMRPGERPFQAARRALGEELGIDNTEDYIKENTVFEVEDRMPVPSISYPGLLTKRTIHILGIYLTERDYKSEGYCEVQEDKTSFFEWKELAF